MNGRSTPTYGASTEGSNWTTSIALAIGAISLLILMMAAATFFAWNQWLNGWPLLQRTSHSALSQPEVKDQYSSGPAVTSTADVNALVTAPINTPESLAVQSLMPNPLKPKAIVPGDVSQQARWTPTPLPTSTPTPSPTPVPTYVSEGPTYGALQPSGLSPGEKWIDVNVSTQTLVAYEGSAPVFQSLVSTGTTHYPTVTGQFRIWLRFPSQDMNGYRLGYDYYLQGVPYVQYFYQDYALHGTFWHNNFGTPMSHGCVNLPTPAAEWIFNWAAYGTLVNIHK